MKNVACVCLFVLYIFALDCTAYAQKVTECSTVESLQQALMEASPDEVISLKPGSYRITEPIYISRNITLRGKTGNPKDVLLESSGEGCLILAADAAKIIAMTIRVKVSEEIRGKSGVGVAAVKIRRGKNMLTKCLITSDKDVGVMVEGEQTDPHIESCEIYECASDGVYFSNMAKGTMANCEIRGNGSFGVYVTDGADPIIRDCKVCNNLDVGIHPRGTGAKGTYENCDVFGNGGSGFCTCSGDSDIVVRNCRIYNCLSDGIASASGLIENCRIYDNGGSGVRAGKNLVLRRCRIENNAEHGVSIVNSSSGTFQHNTLSGNVKGNWYVNGENDKIERIDNSPNE